MGKGENTRKSILKRALDLSSRVGLEGLTIGVLARHANMSKSGLYAHFLSKEDLQSRVLDEAAELFVKTVVAKAIKHPRGLPRIEAFFELWLDWSGERLTGGCPFVAAATEFDDRSGKVRDTLVGHLKNLTESIERSAIIGVEEGHLKPDLDVEQFSFEFWCIFLGYHHFSRLIRHGDARARARRAFEALLQRSREAPRK